MENNPHNFKAGDRVSFRVGQSDELAYGSIGYVSPSGAYSIVPDVALVAGAQLSDIQPFNK